MCLCPNLGNIYYDDGVLFGGVPVATPINDKCVVALRVCQIYMQSKWEFNFYLKGSARISTYAHSIMDLVYVYIGYDTLKPLDLKKVYTFASNKNAPKLFSKRYYKSDFKWKIVQCQMCGSGK